MDIEQSKASLTRYTNWQIDESTFQVLDEQSCTWIARVTTTHRRKAYEDAKKRAEGLPPGIGIELPSSDESSFTVLVSGYEYFVIGDEMLPGLLDWCLKHVERKEGEI